jgi:hypothetical protein
VAGRGIKRASESPAASLGGGAALVAQRLVEIVFHSRPHCRPRRTFTHCGRDSIVRSVWHCDLMRRARFCAVDFAATKLRDANEGIDTSS